MFDPDRFAIDGLAATDGSLTLEVEPRPGEQGKLYRRRAKQPFSGALDAVSLVAELEGVRLYADGYRLVLTTRKRNPKPRPPGPWTWRLYLADGTTYDSNDGRPQDSPSAPRVVAIAQRHADTPSAVLVNGSVYIYHLDYGIWLDHDWPGAFAEARERAHRITAWREGAYLPASEFKAIWAKAREDLADG
jgi:hypothetical protein